MSEFKTEWVGFGAKVKMDETTFNKAIAGGNRLGAGSHKNVKLVSIEPRTFNTARGEMHAFIVTWENDEGQSKTQTIFPLSQNKTTGDTEYSRNYLSFLTAVCGGAQSAFKILDKAAVDGSVLNGLIGARANIVISLPKKGYTVKSTETGIYSILDLESNELADAASTGFDSLESAMAYAKENQIKLAFHNVSQVLFPSSEFLEGNSNVAANALVYQNSAQKRPIQAVSSNRF
jgi:hypothetical protein